MILPLDIAQKVIDASRQHRGCGILPQAFRVLLKPFQATALRVLTLLSCLTASATAAPDVTQVIPLTTGWNLVSVQVGSSFTPAQFQAEMWHPDRLQQVWGYNPTGNPSLPGQWDTFQPLAPPGFPSDVTEILPGRGYWVKVSQTTSVSLSGPAWSGAVSLVPGWNLVGFPGLDLGTSEAQELSAVFGASFNRIHQVWTHNNASKAFEGYDLSAVPQLKQITGVQPGRGYWVYSTSDQPIVLAGQPFVALPSDSDASPPQPSELYAGIDPKYAGRFVRLRAADGSDTTYDLNANGILDDIDTQDTILFEKTADTVSITIGNKGGGGVLPWSLENNVPWLYTAPADERTWPAGFSSRPRDAQGTVSSENDTLLLYADRTGMTPGRKSGQTATLWVGGVEFPIHLLLDVAAIDGDWRGSATTTRVGGRNIPLGEVRLALNSFSINSDEANGFRAVLNREQSILFPRDVYMDGVFYAANQFKLTTNFEMKAGDRNAPPYDTFPTDPKDRDFNGDGKVDAMNPFPFGLRREVTLLGTRVSPDRLEGTYIESIRGMLPPLSGNNLVTDQNQFVSEAFLTQSQPVFVEGTFVLDRQSFTPTQRSVFNESADLGLNIGGSDSTSRSVTFDVTTPVTVQGVTLSLNLTYPDPALLQITLIGPDGTPHVIHEFGDGSAIPTSVEIPSGVFTGAGNGTWTLMVEWDGDTGERGTLVSWGLKIEGAATHKASGRIVKAGVIPAEAITGASIRLEGGVTTRTFTSSTVPGDEGEFEIEDLTENDYTLYISRPGYPVTTATFFIGETDLALGDIALTPLAITAPQLAAAPPIGYAGTQPLHVEFTVDLPLGFGGTIIAWDFDGDGTNDLTGGINDSAQLVPGDPTSLRSLLEPFHGFATPGIYNARVTFSGSGIGTENTFKTQVIHVHRGVADPTGGSQQILVNAFVGALGALTDPGSASPAANPVVVTEVQTQSVTWLAAAPVSLTSGFVFQESLWDAAAFDLDRIPLVPGTPFGGPEDIDLTLNWPSLRYVRFNTNSPNPTKYEAITYLQTPAGSRSVELNNTLGFTTYVIPAGTAKPNRFRIATALGGAVFATQPSAVGDIKIQPGRTLP